MSLPFTATAAHLSTTPDDSNTLPAPTSAAEVARAQTLSRGGTITAGRTPVTVVAAETAPIREQRIGQGDTLATMANYYGVTAEAIAYANGITEPLNLQVGRMLRIPPAEGALYTVVDGDTIETVAGKFKVEPAVIMGYNRLYFEPEHFATDQLIFVPGAALPALVYPPEPAPASTIARAPSAIVSAPSTGGRLAWPVGGTLTQRFSAWHTGVDIAASYGRGIGASEAGVVSAVGWVAVGGLRVCVNHGGGLETCYYHTGATFVGVGQEVARGEAIASIGLTGVTTGPHVHWECRLNGSLVNCLGL